MWGLTFEHIASPVSQFNKDPSAVSSAGAIALQFNPDENIRQIVKNISGFFSKGNVSILGEPAFRLISDFR